MQGASGRNVVRLTGTPVVDTGGAYSSGDCLAPILEYKGAGIPPGYGGDIIGARVVDNTAAQRAAMDILVFSQSVTVTAANAAFDLSDADAQFLQTIIPVLAADYNVTWPGTAKNNVAVLPSMHAVANPGTMALPYKCSLAGSYEVTGATSLWVAAVVRGTPTYVAATDITIDLIVDLY